MTTIKIKDTTKQAKLVIEMLKTFSFVEVVDSNKSKEKEIADLSKKVNNTLTKKLLQQHNISL